MTRRTQPAFPAVYDHEQSYDLGMTLRQWYAGQALVGSVASDHREDGGLHIANGESVDQAMRRAALTRARWCFLMADAMIEAGGES